MIQILKRKRSNISQVSKIRLNRLDLSHVKSRTQAIISNVSMISFDVTRDMFVIALVFQYISILIIAEQVHKGRGGKEGRENPRIECIHRNRPIEESLSGFRAMRDGKYKPKGAFLRMKQDILNNPNPNMWDLTVYRVLEQPHHRTGSTWRVSPTYDFTHCLCDSFENITHSLCMTEFALAREKLRMAL